MDTKDRVSIWAGILTLAVLQLSRDVELDLATGDSAAALGSVVGYVIGFAVLYFIIKWVLEQLPAFKSPPPHSPPPVVHQQPA